MWLFPNPAENQVEIRWEEPFDGQILICDLNGRMVKKQDVSHSEAFVMPLDGLAKGYYFVKRVDQNGMVLDVKKLIVK